MQLNRDRVPPKQGRLRNGDLAAGLPYISNHLPVWCICLWSILPEFSVVPLIGEVSVYERMGPVYKTNNQCI